MATNVVKNDARMILDVLVKGDMLHLPYLTSSPASIRAPCAAPRRSVRAHPLDQIVAVFVCDFRVSSSCARDAARSAHMYARIKSFGTPSPLLYKEPRLIWAVLAFVRGLAIPNRG